MGTSASTNAPPLPVAVDTCDHFSALPTELLELIFAELPVVDLLHVRQVQQRWAPLTRNVHQWARYYVTHIGPMPPYVTAEEAYRVAYMACCKARRGAAPGDLTRTMLVLCAANNYTVELAHYINDSLIWPQPTDCVAFDEALYNASWYGNLPCVNMLIAAGVRVDPPERNLLNIAAAQGHTDVVKALVVAGARATIEDAVKDSAIRSACAAGHVAMVRYLLDVFAASFTPDNYITLLSDAVGKGRLSIVELLLQRGADISDANFVLRKACKHGHADLVDILSATLTRAYLEAHGGHALHTACRYGTSMCASILIARGAPLDYTDFYETPLVHTAAINGHLRVLKLLIDEHGAAADNVASNSPRSTPLCHAVDKCHVAAAEFLIEHGANVNTRCMHKDGEFPVLHLAVFRDHADLVTLLLARGARVDALDSKGRTALALAAEMKRDAILQLLQRSH